MDVKYLTGNHKDYFDSLYKAGKCHPYFYRKYLEFLRTGKYPYLEDTKNFVMTFLPTLNEEQQQNLKSQMYYASSVYRRKSTEREKRKLLASGWRPFDEIANLPNGTKIEVYAVSSIVGTSRAKQVFKIFRTQDNETYLMKPKAKKKGCHINQFFYKEIAVFKLA